jgi:hypothetical protein
VCNIQKERERERETSCKENEENIAGPFTNEMMNTYTQRD